MTFSADILQSILDASLVAANDARQSFRYRVSASGDPCLRALVYDARAGKGRPSADVRYVLAQACGTAVGEVLEAGCARLGMSVQERIELGDLAADVIVSGTLDVRAEGYVLDWKVVGKKSWRRIAKEPDPKHVLQVNAYCAATFEPGWVLAYLNGASIFDELEWRIFRGKADPSAGDKVLATWRAVDGHRKAGTLPDRPADFARDRFPCGWCGHKTECWEGRIMPVNELKDADEMTREELIAEVRIGWRFLWANGRNDWPTEAEFKRLEGEQTQMQREYDAENAKAPQ